MHVNATSHTNKEVEMFDIKYLAGDLIVIRSAEPILESAITKDGVILGYLHMIDEENHIYIVNRKQDADGVELFLGLMRIIKEYDHPIIFTKGFTDHIWEAFHYEFGLKNYITQPEPTRLN